LEKCSFKKTEYAKCLIHNLTAYAQTQYWQVGNGAFIHQWRNWRGHFWPAIQSISNVRGV
jgi:hypothetical protein